MSDRQRGAEERIHIEGLTPTHVALMTRVAEEAADKAVAKTFTMMGMDPRDTRAAQADMVWLRSTRQRCEGVEGKAMLTLVGLLVMGVASTFWLGLKSFLRVP